MTPQTCNRIHSGLNPADSETSALSRYVQKILFCSTLTLFSSFTASAQDENLSLEAILDLKVTVASQKAMSINESPGIVSVITEEDISRSGARDLIDLLHQVPGFQFAEDVQQIIGVGIRGNWGHEGKVLLIVDDHELNENLFQTTQFGNELPVDQIKRIEIIRGPGSAVYGGNAELAVIKVTTKMGEDLKGGRVSLRAGARKGQTARQDISAQVGNSTEKLSYRLSAFTGKSFMTNDSQLHLDGSTIDLSDKNKVDPTQLAGNIKWKGLEISALYRNYSRTETYPYDIPVPEQLPLDFVSTQMSAKYTHEISPKWKIAPQIHWDRFKPWRTIGSEVDALLESEADLPEEERLYTLMKSDRKTQRLRSDLRLIWEPTEEINVVFGYENIQDTADTAYPEAWLSEFATDNGSHLAFSSHAAYTQGIWQTGFANLTAGGRYFKHNVFGDSFVPRVALTKVTGALHSKLLWSKAFRAPGISNIDINPEIQPEQTTVYEGELGYAFSSEFSVVANAFYTKIQDPIIYFVEDSFDGYGNRGQAGSKGVELAMKWNATGFRSNASYSYYNSSGLNEVSQYAVPEKDSSVLAFANHKVTWHADYDLSPSWNLGTNVTWLGTRNSIEASESQEDQENIVGEFKELKPILLADLVTTFRNVGLQGLDVSAGIYNILDQDFRFIQAYDSYHSATPSLDREAVLRVSYSKQF